MVTLKIHDLFRLSDGLLTIVGIVDVPYEYRLPLDLDMFVNGETTGTIHITSTRMSGPLSASRQRVVCTPDHAAFEGIDPTIDDVELRTQR